MGSFFIISNTTQHWLKVYLVDVNMSHSYMRSTIMQIGQIEADSYRKSKRNGVFSDMGGPLQRTRKVCKQENNY
jgi:hypothetical protein